MRLPHLEIGLQVHWRQTRKVAMANKLHQTRLVSLLVLVIEVLQQVMEEAKACLWEMVAVYLKGAAPVASNSRHQWLPTTPELTRLDSHQTFNVGAVRMAMDERHRETSTATGDSRAVASHRCRSSSPRSEVTITRTRTQVSSNPVIESEAP